jgi:hypothetical protein
MEKAISFVWGEMVETMVRLQPVAGVPHSRPAAKYQQIVGREGFDLGWNPVP